MSTSTDLAPVMNVLAKTRFSPIFLLLFFLLGCGSDAEQYADDTGMEVIPRSEWKAATTLTDEEVAAQTVVTDVIERLGGEVSPYDGGDFNSGITVALNSSLVGDNFLYLLKSLVNVKILYLNNTIVTDAGLVHLKELKKLEALVIGETKVTEAGVKKLQKALPDCFIIYY